MTEFHQVAHAIAMTMGLAWASGINLYAAILMLGLLGASGHIILPESLALVAEPPVILAAGFMYMVEFFADKTPGVDSGWDALHTFIRIPAGAVLAAAAVGDVSPVAALAAAIIGGSVTAATHATKAGSRVLINTLPEPFSNWAASLSEDVLVFIGLYAALYHPWFFIVFFVLFVGLMIWLLPKLWRGLKKLFSYFGRLLGKKPRDDGPADDVKPPQLPL